MKSNTARSHHFVPQCYLKNFTDDGTKSGRLTVFSRLGKIFRTKPSNVAKQKDFNTVRMADEPDYIEKFYSTLESDAGPALEEVCASRRLSGSAREHIMMLVTILAVRTPYLRGKMAEFSERVAKHILMFSLRDEPTWRRTLQGMKEAGYEEGHPDVSFEAMKETLKRGGFTYTLENEAHIATELDLLAKIEPYIAGRNWCVVEAMSHTKGFATSDHPLRLSNLGPALGPYGVGLGMTETDLFLPISPRYGLVGRFEELPTLHFADTFEVVSRNARTIASASQQVYGANADFQYKWTGGLDTPFQVGGDLLTDPRFIRSSEAPDSSAIE